MAVDDHLPTVSVVIPALDAAETLPRALQSIHSQDYPRIVEIVVAAGDPDSATVARQLGADVVENVTGRTATGLNLAIYASSGEVVVRCDTHSVLPRGYVSRAVETLARTGAANVGGMQIPVGQTPIGRAIAAAMTSSFGAGDARYRVGGEPGPVETVYLGVFRSDVLQDLDGFNEDYVRTQDYELNHRIRKAGGVVWFDPELRVEYRPRPSLKDLARQYWDYGRAKRQFGRDYPTALRWRQLAPPALVATLGLSVLLSPFWPVALLVPAAYAATTVGVATFDQNRGDAPALAEAGALAIMHLSWGAGFLAGRVRS